MKAPDIDKMNLPGELRNSAMLELQNVLNNELQHHFEKSKDKGDEYLATTLIEKVESLLDELNESGYSFGRCEYGGDINYENSEQWFSNGTEMGTGLVVHFLGFSAKVSWVNA